MILKLNKQILRIVVFRKVLIENRKQTYNPNKKLMMYQFKIR